ncbi:hypothetical protein HMN09_01255200 [Mycena chlorophos]|uniref:Uncharacterized protein n=1 Tax=Mycena chlorophos TaxID=658473 RepID=A0A8H6S5E6_MYCCL|nr:hypothetical protein HMN09_01255200 [Mycena chlorophos]
MGNTHSKVSSWMRILLCASLITVAHASVDFAKCFNETLSGVNGLDGLTDNRGNPVSNLSQATAMTYAACVANCGGGSSEFSWSSFSQQLGIWLLPWVALFSQFPFGCRKRLDNLVSVVLALGSPCLAAYSLALTALNTQWIGDRFDAIRYPNKQWAAVILSSLQQMPLRLNPEGDLPSLVVLSDNDVWWEKLEDNLSYADLHTWSIASATSIAWVIAAYALTVIDVFTTGYDPSNGLAGVGSVWLWMIPVSVGYLQLSPRCDAERVPKALRDADHLIFVASPAGTVSAHSVTEERAFSIEWDSQNRALYADIEATAPIYNYARFLSFAHLVDEVASAFEAAAKKARQRIPVSGTEWEAGDGKNIHPKNRGGSPDEVERYCAQPVYVRRSHWGTQVLSRFLLASAAGLFLQWGTAGGALTISYFTPTVALGCRAASYMIYGSAATLVWIILVMSSFLAHYAISPTRDRIPRTTSQRVAEWLSIFLRRTGKILATLNAAWIIVFYMLNFASFFNSCWCEAAVIGLGRRRAHIDMVLSRAEIGNMNAAWAGGIIFAVTASGMYWGFLSVNRKPLRRLT